MLFCFRVACRGDQHDLVHPVSSFQSPFTVSTKKVYLYSTSAEMYAICIRLGLDFKVRDFVMGIYAIANLSF